MKRLAVITGAWLLVLGLGVAVFWPVNHWRLYDANWSPLAMTEAENFCAGALFGATADNESDPEGMRKCIADSPRDNVTPSIANSARWACEGINSTYPWDMQECMGALEAYDVWMLLNGGYTQAWTESRPRPSVVAQDITQAPRGEREDNVGNGRFGE